VVATSFPPIQPTRVRAAGASHEGPRRKSNEDVWRFVEDDTAALAVIADGMGGSGSGRKVADLVVDTCARIFRGRSTTVLDDLAEIWWLGEHGDPGGAHRARPYSSLPIADRVQLRDRVSLVLDRRVPESMGDVAVLEAETRLLLAIPEHALARANAEVYRLGQKRLEWRAYRAEAVCAIFAAGHASFAHAGTCRLSLVRGDSIEALTREHTLANSHLDAPSPELTREQIAALPAGIVMRAIGMDDTIETDLRAVAIQPGDTFVLSSDGLWQTFSESEILGAVRSYGIGAAAYLIRLGMRDRPGHSGDNLSAVVVQIV
jgi:serine/threonine protein phosphatase PrpC